MASLGLFTARRAFRRCGVHCFKNPRARLRYSTQFPPSREDLPAHRLIPTRVQDTDLLGHVNNVNYYAFMDSAICDWSAANGDNVADAPRYVVETGLVYHASAHYPEIIEVRFGVKVRVL